MKFCSRCKTEKSLDLFTNDKSRKDGKYPTCKDCYNNSRTSSGRGKIYDRHKYEKKKEMALENPTLVYNGQRKCRRCGYIKDVSEFYAYFIGSKDLQIYCSLCERIRSIARKAKQDGYSPITTPIEEIMRVIEESDNRCHICGEKETKPRKRDAESRQLALDHCHDTGKFRGLLCYTHNILAQHSVEMLEKAIEYLQRKEELV